MKTQGLKVLTLLTSVVILLGLFSLVPTAAAEKDDDNGKGKDDWDVNVFDTAAYVGQVGMLRFEYATGDTCCSFEQGFYIRNLNVTCW